MQYKEKQYQLARKNLMICNLRIINAELALDTKVTPEREKTLRVLKEHRKHLTYVRNVLKDHTKIQTEVFITKNILASNRKIGMLLKNSNDVIVKVNASTCSCDGCFYESQRNCNPIQDRETNCCPGIIFTKVKNKK